MDNTILNSDMHEKRTPLEEIKGIKKRLEIGVPIIKTYHNLAFPLSVICCKDKNKGWFYSNFINIYSFYDQEINKLIINFDVQFFEDEVYYLNREKISVKTLDAISNRPIENIIELLNQNKYVILFLDEYYIEESLRYNKEHFDHEFMIYGYDLEEGTFDTINYGNDYHYKSRKMSFKSFTEGYNSQQLNRDLPMMFLSYYEDNEWFRPYYKLDSKYINYSIKNYLKGHNFLYNKRHIYPLNCNSKNKYGIDIYIDLINYLEAMKTDNNFIEVIFFYLLYEHKNCMERRLNYMNEKGYISKEYCDKYQSISNQTRNLIMNIIKINKKRYEDDIRFKKIEQIQQKIQKIAFEEKQILMDITKRLEA